MSLKQPVQYPVKYYSHADVDAPQLANADGVIKTILKACLVTGYGDQQGAGWESLFEDDYRIVLRRPLRTGNPPDIKIENGVINGTASHRIVSQDDPTGIDNTVELASVNLLARDSAHGSEWHLIVSDFGFVLCYQMGIRYSGLRNSLLYVGSAVQVSDTNDKFYATKYESVKIDGTTPSNPEGFFGDNSEIVELRTGMSKGMSGSELITLSVDEDYFGSDYTAQQPFLPTLDLLPFFASVTKNYEDLVTKSISVQNRQMLRYVNEDRQPNSSRPLYIPLDYWEL